MTTVFLTYFLSIVILTLLNKVIKVRASGHACGIAGPLTLAVYFLGAHSVVWCAVIFAAVIWSSLVLKRHTFGELVWGGLTAVAAFFIAFGQGMI